MFEFDPKDYSNYLYGIITSSALKRKNIYPFTLWGEDLILFWNAGNPKCYQNRCRHYGLPLDLGRIGNGRIECGFHGWQYDLADGQLLKAPLARKQPKCALKRYEVFLKGNVVFVYPGDPERIEAAKDYVLDNIPETCLSNSVVYEVPFYLAMNSSMDYPHHAFHTMFYQFYGIYRRLFKQPNPLNTSFTPTLLSEDDTHFKFRIEENKAETTVHPFCSEYYDTVTNNRWQMFIRPINENASQYMITLNVGSRNPIVRCVTSLMFKTYIKYLAMVEDQKWLRSSFKAWTQPGQVHLCDHDFGLRAYLRKFFVRAAKSRDADPVANNITDSG